MTRRQASYPLESKLPVDTETLLEEGISHLARTKSVISACVYTD